MSADFNQVAHDLAIAALRIPYDTDHLTMNQCVEIFKDYNVLYHNFKDVDDHRSRFLREE